ncbi:MAG: type II secretion system F family protein [Sedimentisphaerales bacterium]|nr:type II secretion system F family protein [Sedimentisphaerales bacterium]
MIDYSLLSDNPVTAAKPALTDTHPDASQRTRAGDVFRRIGTGDVCRLARQLSTLLRSGMPLVPALSALVEQLQDTSEAATTRSRPQDRALAHIMKQIANGVNAGNTLSYTLSRYPDVFSGLFVSMVAAGEAGGTLEETLLRLAEMLEKRAHLAAKVKAATVYPLMMVIVATAVVVFLLSFVVPGITQIFLEMNRALPWPTQLLIIISAFIKKYLVLIIILACAAFFGIRSACKTKEGRSFLDRWKLRMPLFGALFLKLEIARLTRTLGMLLASGIPILTALEIAKGVVQNSLSAKSLDSVKEGVSKGIGVAAAMRKTGFFSPIVFHILSTGQVSGEIETGLINIADMYDGEVEITVKALVSLLEPAILLVMGVVVGLIVLAILLPILEINQAL